MFTDLISIVLCVYVFTKKKMRFQSQVWDEYDNLIVLQKHSDLLDPLSNLSWCPEYINVPIFAYFFSTTFIPGS